MSKHVQKTLQKMAKKNSSVTTKVDALKGQYKIIQNDLIKLRDDLQKGFDMAKSTVNKKTIFNEILKLK